MDIREERKNKITGFMRENAYKPLLLDELMHVLDVPKEETEVFKEVMNELELEGRVFKTHRKRYGIPERMNLLSGTYTGNSRGFGFVIPEREDKEDIFIPSGSENGAFNGDFVIVRVNKKVLDERRAEGEVIKILRRKNNKIIGTFERNRHFGFLIPDNRSITKDIYIEKKYFNNAVSGDKVEAEIIRWPDKRRNAEGKITEILGKSNDIKTEVYSLIKSYDIDEVYPEKAINEAEQIPDIIDKSEIKKRTDLRKNMIFTIDGEDAKDLDDAVSIEKLKNGNYKLGVHIADVSHYVTENSALDREAYKRGTSIYLTDRVIPMLPERLSNGICSLNPDVDRLTFSVQMEIDKKGKVEKHEIFESIIKSDYRMTYTDVTKIIEGDNTLREKYKKILKTLENMNELASILSKKRKERGALEFNKDEISVVLDDSGKPVNVKKRERNIAHGIIEEFMIICNETVAEHFYWKNAPFVFRIHEKPEEEKVETLLKFAYNFGYSFKASNVLHPGSFQKLLEQVKGKDEEKIINNFMLRSMKKAKYSHFNDGHFGLSSLYYSHFTSPIRRYPDLIIHRLIKEDLKGSMSKKRLDKLTEKLPGISKHCTDQEIRAEQIERDMDELYTCIFMKEHENEVFDGVITNVTSSAIFIELDNMVEGAIKLSDMIDDYYIFNDKQFCLVGERTRKVYKIGMKLKVIVKESDISSRRITLKIYEK
jgi:ribonuclease R